MKILLIANYENDRQESMRRFAGLLESELRKIEITVEVIRPLPFFGSLKPGATGLGKWLGYLDKFFIFPFLLKRRVRQMGGGVVVHICDHSNAFYTRWVRATPHLVTCNDVLAIRSALGEFPQNRTGFTGRCLQRLILNGLRRARRITCISEATRSDLLRLLQEDRPGVDVTAMGVNSSWSPMPAEEAAPHLKSLGVSPPYILHVGGDQWYKNRAGVISIWKSLGDITQRTKLVMVGPGLSAGANVICLPRVEDETLRALYSLAELLLFPSFEEGFGWPIVEAQACGCRVATTEKAPMTEAGGGAAFLLPVPPANPDNGEWAGAAAQVVKILLAQDAPARAGAVERGLENASRFSPEIMAQRYVAIYKELLYNA